MLDYAGFDVDSPGDRRLSIYRFVFRTLPDPFMDAMDCPDASQLTPIAEHIGHRAAGPGDAERPLHRALQRAPGRAVATDAADEPLRLPGCSSCVRAGAR